MCGGGVTTQRHAVPQRDDADHAVLEPLRGVAHGGFARLELLVVLGIHEGPEIAVLVEILHLRVHDVGGFDRLAGAIALLDGAAGAAGCEP